MEPISCGQCSRVWQTTGTFPVPALALNINTTLKLKKKVTTPGFICSQCLEHSEEINRAQKIADKLHYALGVDLDANDFIDRATLLKKLINHIIEDPDIDNVIDRMT